MNIDQTISILKRIKLLSGMSEHFLYALAFSAETIAFSTGDVLIKSKSSDVKVIIILEGRAFVQKKSNPIELKSGSMIGILSLINNESMKDPVIAGSIGECLILNRDLFDKLSKEFKDFPAHLVSYIHSQLTNQIEELSEVIS